MKVRLEIAAKAKMDLGEVAAPVAVAADGSVIILHFPSDQELGLYIILLHLESYKGHLEWNSRLYTQSVHYLCDMLCGEVSGQTGALSCQ